MSKMKLALNVVEDLRSLADSIEILANAAKEEPEKKKRLNKLAESDQEETLHKPGSFDELQTYDNTQTHEKLNKKGQRHDAVQTYLEVNEKLQGSEKEQPQKDKTSAPTLEEVRAAMATKNKEGHRDEIKAIIFKYGANKLTSIDPKHYSDVLQEVEEIT
jgi:hypothetical protein